MIAHISVLFVLGYITITKNVLIFRSNPENYEIQLELIFECFESSFVIKKIIRVMV